MNPNRSLLFKSIVAFVGVLTLLESAQAQSFLYTNNDLLLGFRKTGVFQENYEVVVNIGKATNYVKAVAGTTFNVPNFAPTQLVPDSFSDFNHLNWSVFGFVSTNLTSRLPGYVNNTLWLTVPRIDSSVQTVPPNRLSYSAQGQGPGKNIKSIGVNASFLSSQSASNQDNTATLVREPVNDPADLTAFIGGVASSSDSTLRDTWTQNNLENTTPASFSSSVVSDLYEVTPTTDQSGTPIVDPHTKLTNGPAYYVGYFQFNSDGTMTFARGSSTTPPPPPPPSQISASRLGTVTTISFTTTNGATYTLYYTNGAGLTQPVTAWSSLPTTVAGDGSIKSFTDNSNDLERFYRVAAR
jgi:hypothetical protein